VTRAPRKPAGKSRGGAAPGRPAADKRRPPRSKAPPPRRGLPALALILAVLAVAVAGGFLWLGFGPGPAPPEGGETTTVVLEHGSGLPQIANALAEAKVIRLPFAFAALAKMTGAASHLRAGEYAIPAHASTAEILGLIRAGKIVRHLVTVPEGMTSAEVAEMLNANPVLTGQAPVAAEGSIMPQTYDVERGEDRADVVREMAAAQAKLVSRLWRDRRPGLPYRTPEQALTLASIIEKETAVPAERPHVAAVYLNRLATGMRLESDPTIIYGLTQGRPLGRSLTHADVVQPTAWNTYVISGLPPTPIANPGRASIEAALNPSDSRDLYFVADGTGGHVFAQTFEEHEKNVDRWRAIAQAMKGR
jgi:UPF0755 protein